LYGIDAVLHLDPLVHVEAMALARIARAPLPGELIPSDTYVASARIFGDRAGFSYAADGAYEVGRFGIPGSTRQLRAFAAAAHVDWQPGWALRPKVTLAGSYASGDDGTETGRSQRFDPILPERRTGIGSMGLYAWSNIIDPGLEVAVAPSDEIGLGVDYRYLLLADPHGAWIAASLAPIGQNRQNESRALGHELDAFVSYTPLESLMLSASYGALIAGDGARAILSAGHRSSSRVLHSALFQARLTAF
jgi:hypothetical protein